MRILLVEDDALLGDGLRAGLQQSAFAVDWVRDGPSAEEALRTNPYAAADAREAADLIAKMAADAARIAP